MAAWDDVLKEFIARPEDDKGPWLQAELLSQLQRVSGLRGDRNVILYGSAFLQKPQAPASATSIMHEDLNGLMTAIYGMDWSKGLTLLLHTPGGVTNAAETLVAYLRSKFAEMEVIVPTLAMSAGTMIALSTGRIVMGKQSQLGPIDPQMTSGGRTVSARAVVEQFGQAHEDILKNPQAAHVWAPVLAALGPSLLQEAQNALAYSEEMVAKWLATGMLKDSDEPEEQGKAIAAHFNDAQTHKSHGRRIDRDEARAQGVVVEDLEASQELQDAVLTAYHLMTLVFEHGPAAKTILTSHGRTWLKNWGEPGGQPAAPQGPRRPGGAPPPNRAQRRKKR
ncbi:hypothetical protein [Conexibacter sp. SYSU D00693]|uniref:SDH family Clp fold serine proteinase n=1 Tax=Conexibacter sp. SYSU D00693 TaxID=2812560 RepID=UPI00196B222F|nr:hypothetical protein [Conexibacter sp. SYSU D00693]